jgi:phenylalanyl-tRNA synthetase alpha chain
LLDSRAMDAAELLRALDDEHSRGRAALTAATTIDELDAAQVAVLGRKSPFGQLQRALGTLPNDDRRDVGARVNEIRADLQQTLGERRSALGAAAEQAQLAADRIDVTLPGRRPRPGSLHPLTLVEREIVDVFTSLGFRVVGGPEIEDDWHNFQALNIPPDHPARTMKDSLYVAIPGHPELLLRTETSAAQIRTMQAQHFPFVEPGAEVGVSCFRCDGVGCAVCGNGWIELLGAGMVHPTVLENCGYDAERYTGFAFGLGVERVALLRYAIPDMRMLIDGDVRFLAQFGVTP